VEKFKKLLASDTFIENLRQTDAKHHKILANEFFLLTQHDLSSFKDFLANIDNPPKAKPKQTLTSEKLKKHTLLHSYIITENRQSYIEINNAIPEPVEVLSINYKTNDNQLEPITFSKHYNFPFTLAATPIKQLPKRYLFNLSHADLTQPIVINARLKNSSDIKTYTAMPYVAPLTSNPLPDTTLEQALKQNPFINLVDKENKILAINSGTWQVNDFLIVPKGYQLNAEAGTQLLFSEGTGLIAYGSLNMLGTQQNPILLDSKNSLWNGVFVYGNEKPSHWRYVTVKNTSGMQHEGWKLRGATTFYQSQVILEHCNFLNNHAEDAINFIHTQFSLQDCQINQAASDGLDADFSTGIIRDCVFENIGHIGGGDAIDIGGSTVEIYQTSIKHINDKALSVGENSHVVATNLTIDGAGSGIVSKDGSNVSVSFSSIEHIKNIPLMAYIKKSQFGPAKLTVNNTIIEHNNTQAVAQTGSEIKIDNHSIETTELAVDKLYENIMKSNKPI